MTRAGAGPRGAAGADRRTDGGRNGRRGGSGPPGGSGPGSRLVALNEPRRVRVRADERGVPLALATEGRRRRVEAVRESWRIDDEWWRRPIVRLYHTVVLEDGALVTLFRDLEDGGWYLHG